MKPILFNTEMVRAILDGRKTVTRRPMKLRYRDDEYGFNVITNAHTGKFVRVEKMDEDGGGIFSDGTERVVKPPYSIGDILWVRETFFREECIQDCTGRSDPNECPFNRVGDSCYGYKTQYIDSTGKIKWRPSIHMPLEAARLFLRVTGVRVERLQSITPTDCIREGVEREAITGVDFEFARGMFSDIWDTTIKTADLTFYGWEANPWVWVIAFERISKEAGHE